MYGGACDQWFPSKSTANQDCTNVNTGDCVVGQFCCPTDRASVECGGNNIISTTQPLSTDTYHEGYRNCPVAGSARVFGTNRADPANVYCRANCRCVYPCESPQRPGTRIVETKTNLGQYSRLNNPDYKTRCKDNVDPFSQDDVYAGRWEPTNIIWREYWYSDDPECEKRSCSEYVIEYYVRTYCYDMMSTFTCEESCTLTVPATWLLIKQQAFCLGPGIYPKLLLLSHLITLHS
jgi:hypothetical protein